MEQGNLYTKPNGQRGWVMGYFMPESSPYHNEDFELQWAELKKGTKREHTKPAHKTAKTLSILGRGKHRITFTETGEEILLEKEGDYVYFDAATEHSWEALEDSLIISVRWPSEPDGN